MDKERRRRHIAALLLLIFAAFACGNTLCVHSHVNADGGVVTHSHPYLPSSGHSHSAAQLLTLAAVNAIGFESADGVAGIMAPQQLCTTVHAVAAPAAKCAAGLDTRSLRAPPVIA